MTRVFVAAGSNVDPIANLRLARDELERTFGAVTLSTAWQNRAVGFEGPDFVNFVAAFDTDRPVEAVIVELQRIEGLCGRPRDAPKWAPRSMDLDILLYGDLICDRPGLTLPRPDLLRRPYMLGPMAEIAPGLRHPTAGETMAALWARFPRDHVMRRVDV
jgi:2-amino-4-hydroxy-6-hydroxymethyldihydropteridine diphosphokinase